MVSRTFASSSNTFVSALVVVGALTALVCGGPAAIAGTVVFGNLGPTGAGGLDSTNTDMGPTASTVRALAQGFTTGSDAALLSIESVTIGAFAGATPVSRFVSIYSNGAGNVPGSKLFDSAAVSVSGQAKYVFNFSGVSLLANTSYWVVPDFSVDWSWYLDSDFENPSGQNASGYAYLGSKRTTPGAPSTWVNGLPTYSLSIEAASPSKPPFPKSIRTRWAASSLWSRDRSPGSSGGDWHGASPLSVDPTAPAA
ncbi:MAG: choice-of-anchor R domain-containing protein [Planctomycetaceae bacterium]